MQLVESREQPYKTTRLIKDSANQQQQTAHSIQVHGTLSKIARILSHKHASIDLKIFKPYKFCSLAKIE